VNLAPSPRRIFVSLLGGLTLAALPAQSQRAWAETPRGYLGVYAKSNQNVLEAERRLAGVTLTQVVENSPAEAADLRPGDVILSANDVELADPAQLLDLAETLPIGALVRLKVERDGRILHLEARTVERVARRPARPEEASWVENRLLGLEFGPVDPALAERLGLTPRQGVRIIRLAPASPLSAAGLRPGDVIAEIEGEPVHSPEWFQGRISAIGGDRTVRFKAASPDGDWREAVCRLKRPPGRMRNVNIPFVFGWESRPDGSSLFLPLYILRRERVESAVTYRVFWFWEFEMGPRHELLELEPR